QNTKAGDDLELTYYRDGQLNSAKGTLMSYNEVYADDEIWAKADNYVVDEEEVEVDMDRAFLGVFVETLSKEKARKMGFDNPYGSFVTGVIKNSAAAKAGLQPFDYIFGIDEYRVGENQSLGGILTRYHPGDEATIHFIRKRKKNKANLTFGTYFKYKKEVRNSCEDPFLGINQMSNEDKSIAGVRISPVEGTTAEEMGLQKGDIIQTINDYTIVDWDDVKLAIDMMNPGETITVKYLRDGVKKSSSKPIKSYAETKNCDDCDCGRKKIEVHVNDAPFENLTFSWRDKSGDEGERDNLEGATISVEDVTAEEMQTLQQKGIITEAANNLEIRKMRIAPDAAAGLFQISFELSSSGDTQVRVHNSAGRTIYEYDLGEFSGEFSDEVDISQNGPGNYYLQIRQDGKSFTKKIVLAKD
ncbi:MAG: PDZ domain-containing protein, partial [Saprospiraceae bacterium]